MAFFAGFLTYSLTGGSIRSPVSTTLLLWHILVVSLRRTGVSNRSEMSKAALVKSRHSWLSDGSSMGTLACRAYHRLSCSFWELESPGSSAETMTRPPFTPM